MEDKCFCHLNGYRVKDAEARNRIETLEAEYRLVNIPLGELMISINEEAKNYDLTETAQLEGISKFISDVAKSDITKPLFKIINTSFNTSGEGTINTDCTEILFTTCVTDIKPTENVFMFYGFIQTSENDKWNVKLVVLGEWNNEVFTANTVKIFFTKQSFDLTGYATEEYVNDAIANIDIPEGGSSGIDTLPIIYSTKQNLFKSSGALTSDDISKFTELLNKFNAEGQILPGFVLKSNGATADVYGKTPELSRIFYLSKASDTSIDYYSRYYHHNSGGNDMAYLATDNVYLTVSKNDNVYTCTNAQLYTLSMQAQFLHTANGKSYTPTSNYHPATKKYVDDSHLPYLKSIEGYNGSGFQTLRNVNGTIKWVDEAYPD